MKWYQGKFGQAKLSFSENQKPTGTRLDQGTIYLTIKYTDIIMLMPLKVIKVGFNSRRCWPAVSPMIVEQPTVLAACSPCPKVKHFACRVVPEHTWLALVPSPSRL